MAQRKEAERLHRELFTGLRPKEGVSIADARAAVATIAAYNSRLVELGIPSGAGLVLPELPEEPESPAAEEATPAPAADQASDTPAEDSLLARLAPYGRRWEKGGKRRFYLDLRAVAEAVGFSERGSYSHGRKVSTFAGEEISNSSARKMAAEFDGAFYDLDARKFVGAGTIFEAFRAYIGA